MQSACSIKKLKRGNTSSDIAPIRSRENKHDVFSNDAEFHSTMRDMLSTDGKGRDSKLKMLSKIIISPRIVCYDLENSDSKPSNSKLISSKGADSRSG